jgi:hypothetical protein
MQCNYAGKYSINDNLFEFGMIKYFLQIHKNGLVAVNKLKIIGNILHKISMLLSALILLNLAKSC